MKRSWKLSRMCDFCCYFDAIPLFCDNESSIKLANYPVQHSRTKHIDIRHHFLQDHEAKGDIALQHVSTDRQLVDIFTKPVDESKFCALRRELNILDSHNLVWTIAYTCVFVDLVFSKMKRSWKLSKMCGTLFIEKVWIFLLLARDHSSP